jgi:hypothetical protein
VADKDVNNKYIFNIQICNTPDYIQNDRDLKNDQTFQFILIIMMLVTNSEYSILD